MSNGSAFRVARLTKIHEFWGEEPTEFSVQLHCEVTKAGDRGGEAFQVTVASLHQLPRELQGESRIAFGRGYIFMLDYDERIAISQLQTLLDGSGSSSTASMRNIPW